MATNTAKYLSYAEAWRRINAASKQDFHFEVVTLCESILSDRLLSYICGVNPKSKATTKTSFANLISEWRKLASGKIPQHGNVNLGAAIDDWRKERNAVVHSLTKSAPGMAPEPLQPFITRAKLAADSGVLLAKAVSNWHRKELRAYLKAQNTRAVSKTVANPSINTDAAR